MTSKTEKRNRAARKYRKNRSEEQKKESIRLLEEYRAANAEHIKDVIDRTNVIKTYTGKYKAYYAKKKKTRERGMRNQGFIVDYKGETYYCIAEAARRTRFTAKTIKVYIDIGVIPRPIYWGTARRELKYVPDNKIRYISATQVQLINKAFRKVKNYSRAEASRWLHDNWTKHEKNIGDKGNDRSIN
jgi:hypothetical protein